MQSLYYLAMLLGVAWLAVWSILPPERRGIGWWPFDMRDGGEVQGGAHTDARDRRDGTPTRHRAQRTQGHDNAAQVPEVKHPAHDRGAAQSWRARRERSQASQRIR